VSDRAKDSKHHRKHTAEEGAVEASWSETRSFPLCGLGDKAIYEGRARFLDAEKVSSVRKAADYLNKGRLDCPEGFCVVWSESKQEFWVLHRTGCLDQAEHALGLVEPEQPPAQGAPAPGGSGVSDYRQRRCEALARKQQQESMSYARRRQIVDEQMAAIAKATGEEPKPMSFPEWRKNMGYTQQRQLRGPGAAAEAPSVTISRIIINHNLRGTHLLLWGSLASQQRPSATSSNSPAASSQEGNHSCPVYALPVVGVLSRDGFDKNRNPSN